ncbi:MAG: GNAT family N-acetyltransferase [Pirellulales bacterium]
MSLTYFKRFRMEIDLRGRDLAVPALPMGYRLIPWDGGLVESHAEAKYYSFRHELDANVFPCLGEYTGCLRLMREIVRKDGFLPGATWLLAANRPGSASLEYCGTVQGIRDRSGMGAIQNLGITPDHRDRGLGTALLLAALDGFRQVGLRWAFLEVTAQNQSAIQLYRRLGFNRSRTVYKAVEVLLTS